jgi:hypothetical protein
VLARTPSVAMLPAGVVPVSAKIWSLGRHDDDVSGARRDLLLATRADVGLDRLERLNPADLRRTDQRGINAHRSIPATIAAASATIT